MKKTNFPSICKLFFLFAIMLMLVQPVQAQAATRSIRSASDFHKISKYNGGTFKLTRNIKLTSTKQYLTITKNKKYTLDLNGYKITSNFYTSGKIRDYTPIHLKKGTLILKNSSKKRKGHIISTEGSTISVTGGKLYIYKNVNISCANVGFFKRDGVTIMNQACGLYIGGGTVYTKGGTITGICNGVNMTGGRLYTYGAGTKTYPTFTGKYANGLYIFGKNCKVSLTGGSFISQTGNWSGYYPIMDYYGNTLKLSNKYRFVQSDGKTCPIHSFFTKYVTGAYNNKIKGKYIGILKK